MLRVLVSHVGGRFRSAASRVLPCLLCAAAIAGSEVSAQGPVLVKDINAVPVASNPSSIPTPSFGLTPDIVKVGAFSFFAATEPGTGLELYITQGTAASTRLVLDINPGPNDSSPHGFMAVGSMLLFFANDGNVYRELWKSDGTAAGTTLVKDIIPGPALTNPWRGVGTPTHTYFTADDGVSGEELWKSDGTEAGTVMVKDIYPGTTDSSPVDFVALGGCVYFSARSPFFGEELWKSDGTAAGTVMVQDLNPGQPSSSPQYKTVAGGAFYFLATGPSGRGVWKSDGAIGGVALMAPGFHTSVFAGVGNVLFFGWEGGSNLWKSDGTVAGTVLVKQFAARITNLSDVGGLLFFSADDGINGTELWKSDGTAAGTELVLDINPGGPGSSPSTVTLAGGIGYFSANNGLVGDELWRTDGTASGTTLVRDIRPGAAGSVAGSNSTPFGATNHNGLALFVADDGVAGREVWASSGTAATTVSLEVAGLAPNATLGSSPSAPDDSFVDLHGVTLFAADDGIGGEELWRSDGTPNGTFLIKNIQEKAGSSSPLEFTEVDGVVYFTADDGIAGRELWKTDGTAAGTALVSDILPGSPGSNPHSLIAVGDKLFFYASAPGGSSFLWTGVTEANTVRLVRVTSSPPASTRELMAAVGDTLFFVITGGPFFSELWKSDGTVVGTTFVKDLIPSVGSSGPVNLAAVGDTLFFSARSNTAGSELWKSDGTRAGTVMVRDISPGTQWSSPGYAGGIVGVGDTAYFDADDGVSGRELWKSDGTFAGTVQVKDIYPGSSASRFPTSLTAAGDRLFFTADDGVHGRELWVSDGTTPGTFMAKDIATGNIVTPPSSLPTPYVTTGSVAGAATLTAVGSRRVYFAATQSGSGRELWTSDGTSAGTILVGNVWPGPGSTTEGPHSLVVSGPRLLFRADDGVVGSELWSLSPGAIAQVIGRGCGGALRAPALRATDPVLGGVMQVSVSGVPVSSGALVIGNPTGAPFPLLGCPVYLDLTSPVFVMETFAAAGSGFASGYAVPTGVQLIGAELALQAFLVGALPGLEWTNGVRLTFGL